MLQLPHRGDGRCISQSSDVSPLLSRISVLSFLGLPSYISNQHFFCTVVPYTNFQMILEEATLLVHLQEWCCLKRYSWSLLFSSTWLLILCLTLWWKIKKACQKHGLLVFCDLVVTECSLFIAITSQTVQLADLKGGANLWHEDGDRRRAPAKIIKIKRWRLWIFLWYPKIWKTVFVLNLFSHCLQVQPKRIHFGG